ncbi:MAG TPA: DUF1223 domain-containing protein [Rhizomicrobium sp.]|jgi:hypothetical protein|nr:DUF1223 domain-containing protein [Rhizomicrobium sp.]
MVALALAFSGAEAGARRQLVVELFTSQGCSSCPPADALLGKLADRKDILALSLPVTYWDMLGWKDTLASEANTRRQKGYAAAMGRGGIYTPQMIVDGATDVVGSREAQIESIISARAADMRSVPVSLSATPEVLHVSIGAGSAKNGSEATVWLFHILSHTSVHITSGENLGRNLNYRNSVRDVRAIGIWKGQPLSLDLPRSDPLGSSYDTVAVVLQEGGYGRIIGAAILGSQEIRQ